MGNVKKILKTLIIVFSLLYIVNVKADTKNIFVDSISVKDKSGTISVVDPVLESNEVTSNITFNQIDDFVTFELTIKNNEDEKYKITSIKDNNTNENISLEYNHEEDYISKGETTTVTIKIKYKKQLVNVEEVNLNNLTIAINLVNEDGEDSEIVINPVTGDKILHYLLLLIIAITGFILINLKKKIKGIKVGRFLIVLSIIMIPFVTFAKEKYELNIRFTDIVVKGEFETYDISVDPGNGDSVEIRQITYGQKLGNLPANPTRNGYIFNKWTDAEGNEVTKDTIITKEIEVIANYTPITYNITYNLNDGQATNPSTYTIESQSIILSNPSKTGYTFTGWTGTEIDVQTTSVTIEHGSTGDRTYTANYTANEDTEYKVIHKFAKLNGGYDEETVIEHGTTGTTVPAPRKTRTGYVTPEVQNVYIEADGSSKVTYTYDREEYEFSITDRTYIDETVSTSNDTYPYGTSITVKAVERAGYDFTWNDGNENYERTFELESAISLTPVYTAKTNTPYVVKHYKQKITLDGYEIEDTQNLSGTTGSPISPAVNTYTGFISPEVQSTTIAGDESTVVEYYYDRESYEVTFNTDGGSDVSTQTVIYGQKVTRPVEDPTKENNTFDDWYTTNGYTTLFDFTNTIIESDTTIYAKFILTGGTCEDFSTDSWGTIKANIETNPSYYPVGCEKEVELDINYDHVDESYTVRIANTSTPEVCSTSGYSQTACGVVIEFKDLLIARQVHYNGTNSGGWTSTSMVTWLNDDFYSKLPTDLKEIIIPTYPIVSGSGPSADSSNITADDNDKNLLYLLSTREVGFDIEYDNKKDILSDTRVLDYYEDTAASGADNKRIKKDLKNKAQWWWLRSAKSDDNYSYYNVGATGAISYDTASSSNAYYVAPAFRIGTKSYYTVTFDTDGGSRVDSQVLIPGQKAVKPYYPVKEGYTFDNWYTDNTYTTVFDFENTNITKNTVIYGRWTYCNGFAIDSWADIKANLEGDSSYYAIGCQKEVAIDMDGNNKPESYTVRLANTSVTPECQNVEGYSQTACGNVIEFVDLVNKRRMGGTSGWKSTTLITYLNDNFYNKLPSDLKEVIIPTYPIVSGSGPSGESDNVTKYDVNLNKIYLLSGREVGHNYEYDNKKNILTDTRTLDYYQGTFDRDRKREKRNLSGEEIYWWLRTQWSSDIIYYYFTCSYAWSGGGINGSDYGIAPAFRIGTPASFIVSFESNGGTSVADQIIDRGEKAIKPENPTKDDYNFVAWYSDANLTTLFDFDTPITDTTKLYAKWMSSDYVAEMNGTGYESLQLAVNAAQTNPSTIRLLKDTSEAVAISSNQDITIDLNTNTISNIESSILFNNSGTLKIIDGSITHNTSTHTIKNNSSGALELKNVNISSTETTCKNVLCNDGGTALIGNGTIITTISSSSAAIENQNNGSLIIDGALVTASGARQGVYNNIGTVEIKGDTLISASPTVDSNKRGAVQNNDGTLIISGGTIVSNNYGVTVTAGTFRVGTENGRYNKTTPEIRGGINGINSSVDYSVYDGIFEGKTAGVNDESKIVSIETDSTKETSSITIETEVYQTLYYDLRVDYTVTLDANGGVVSPTSITKDLDVPIGNLPIPTPPTGKEFAGWYTGLDTGVEVDSSFTPNDDETIYARYNDIKYTVTFDTGDGSSVPSQEIVYGETATRPEDPTKDDSIFIGWYIDDGYENVFVFSTSITQDVTIYAKWNQCNGFASDSWSTIKENIDSNSDYYGVGCEKEVAIDMNDDLEPETYKLRIANTSTPNLCGTYGYSQTACGVVLEFVEIVEMNRINTSSTNKGGWKSSYLATYLNDDFYNKLPSDLKDIIIPTYPIVSGSGSNNDSLNVTSDDNELNKLYLFTNKELDYNLVNDTTNDYTRVLDYYIGTNDSAYFKKRVKKDLNGDEQTTWLRSAYPSSTYYFKTINVNGTTSYSGANSTLGVSPAFRIGKDTISLYYDPNGGTISNPSKEIIKGETIGELPTPTPDRMSLLFDGWYTEREGGEKVTSNYIINNDTTIYARYIDGCGTFSTDSWATIASNLESDPTYYPVDCRKEVEMDMDDDNIPETYTVRLANTTTTTQCTNVSTYSQTACGTVIEFVDIVTLHRMSSVNSNSGGWKNTEMVVYLNSDFYDKLPEDLRSVIIPTYPIVSSNGSGGTSPNITAEDTNINKIYLLSSREIGINMNQDNKNNINTDTRTLDYYVGTSDSGAESRRIKYDINGVAKTWLIRTLNKYEKNMYSAIANDGHGVSVYGTNANGVSPAFRIGTNN
ncbi:MAG: InlB B-repeat-containing protein [Bacilli bacterium]|nr:InlB B-repeat-containing protein [Bacilli bacterium]